MDQIVAHDLGQKSFLKSKTDVLFLLHSPPPSLKLIFIQFTGDFQIARNGTSRNMANKWIIRFKTESAFDLIRKS